MISTYFFVSDRKWVYARFLIIFFRVFHLAVEQSEHLKDLKKNEASRGVEYFQDRLGLYFTKQKGNIIGKRRNGFYYKTPSSPPLLFFLMDKRDTRRMSYFFIV